MKNKQLNISSWVRKIFVRKKYKDFLFRRVFEDKKDLLELYNALNGTDYKDPDELEITTLEDVIYMSMKNDLSFIISSTLNLYEHQSTFNPNMPIRGLLYFSKMYEAYIKLNKLDLYGKSQVPLPTPQYVVFYNGRDEQPDERILTLSDAFMPKKEGIEPVLECRARMLNINYGHNEKILNTCKRLHDYSYFIAEVNANLDRGMKLKDAIEKAIDSCIENGILADILIKHRAEVFDMLLTEYDEKLHMKTVKAEGYEEGRMAGEMAGFLKGEENGLEALVNTIKSFVGDDFDKVKEAVIKNEHYANVSDEDIRKYM